MCIEEDEETGHAVAPVLILEVLPPARLCRDGRAHFADELGRAFIEADDRPLGIGRLGIKVEHVLHAGDVFGINLGKCTTCPCARA